MLLRISLIIAALAAAAGLYFSFNVSGRLKEITEERDTAKTEADTARAAESTARSAERKAKTEAEETKTQLADVTEREKTASGRAQQQLQRADRLQIELERTSQEKNQAQQALAAFEATGVTAAQVKNLNAELAKAHAARDALVEEKDIFTRHIEQLETNLRKYENPDQEVKLPPGLKGKVLTVDPKYGFVVVDLGSDQGVLKDGKLSISRDGRLIAKVKAITVDANKSIANILPEWQQGEIMEGDQVLTGYEALAQP